MRPVIGILMRNGMHYSDFSDLARSVYVEVASEEFGIKGRRTNTSRIALLTGLSRIQAKRELDLLDAHSNAISSSEELDKVRHASRVLLGWHTDPRFCDDKGRPRLLTVDGDASFATLYEEFSGKAVTETSMLKELIAVGAVEKLADGRLKVKARSYVPNPTDQSALHRIFLAISDLAGCAYFNLFKKKDERSRFERFATNQLIPESELDEFRDYLEVEGQEFLERVDDWLSKREADKSRTDLRRVGVGVYQVSSKPVKPPND